MPFNKSKKYNPWRRSGVRYVKSRTVGTQAGTGMSKYSKSSKASNFITKIPRAFGNPVAQRTFVWLRYNEDFGLSTGASGLPSVAIFNLNSIFDPDRTGVGHQPYGHDTYQSLYNRYRVHKFRWNICISAAGSTPLQVTIAPLNNVNTTSSTSMLEQSALAKRTILQPTGENLQVFSGSVSLNALNGVSKVEYQDDRFQANFGFSPVELMSLTIILNNIQGVVSTGLMNLNLEYYTELFDPISLAQS